MCASVSPGSFSTEPPAAQLADLDAEYSSLQGAIAGLRRGTGSRPQQDVRGDVERELAIEASLEPLFDRCQEIAWQVAETAALSPSDLLVKARIMLDRIDIEPHDVGAALTLSLCRDLSSLLTEVPALSRRGDGGGQGRSA